MDQTSYLYFEYDCGCIGYKQVSTLRRRGAAALACPEHGGGRKAPSSLLLRVRTALLFACPELGPVVLEANLLKGQQKSFDLWFPKWQIAAEVDGSQHFRGSMHGKAAKQQYQRDRRIDAACKRQRLRLLRFHHEDWKQWGGLLQHAIKAVAENPHCWFCWHTKSYDFEAGAQAAAPTL